jgi:hypothetical protein
MSTSALSGGMPVQVDTAHYQAATYEQRERLYSYVEQVSLVSELGGQSVIEVGCGSRVVTELLRMRGIDVTTVDFDASLKPDVVCGVENILLPDAHADIALCCQVLEHLPFSELTKCTNELLRVCRTHAVISIPDARPHFGFTFMRGIYRYAPKHVGIEWHPLRPAQPHTFDGQHHWELGKKETPLRTVLAAFNASSGSVTKHFRHALFPYHTFFVIKKMR